LGSGWGKDILKRVLTRNTTEDLYKKVVIKKDEKASILWPNQR
jgi:hypothetical protein